MTCNYSSKNEIHADTAFIYFNMPHFRNAKEIALFNLEMGFFVWNNGFNLKY